MSSAFDLDRFVEAQDGVYETARAEIEAGRKQSHWMWFIFPQLAGLGHSPDAMYYAIDDRAEAEAYLAHPILGPRLIGISEALSRHKFLPIELILGSVDAMKLRSSATLFAAVSDAPVFAELLDQFFDGKACEFTENQLGER
ncbi:MAG: DUF1810 domain-containing protein [Pseudomonadota bacterium]